MNTAETGCNNVIGDVQLDTNPVTGGAKCRRCDEPVKSPTHPHNARHCRFCSSKCRSLFHYENNKAELKVKKALYRQRVKLLKLAASTLSPSAITITITTNDDDNTPAVNSMNENKAAGATA